MVSMMDNTSDWLTKRQASEVLGISEKGIQRLAAKGGIQSRQLKRPDGVVVTMYHPQDVEQVRRERSPEGGQSFVVPAKKAAPGGRSSHGCPGRPGWTQCAGCFGRIPFQPFGEAAGSALGRTAIPHHRRGGRVYRAGRRLSPQAGYGRESRSGQRGRAARCGCVAQEGPG